LFVKLRVLEDRLVGRGRHHADFLEIDGEFLSY
jgi:hypothetical protein